MHAFFIGLIAFTPRAGGEGNRDLCPYKPNSLSEEELRKLQSALDKAKKAFSNEEAGSARKEGAGYQAVGRLVTQNLDGGTRREQYELVVASCNTGDFSTLLKEKIFELLEMWLDLLGHATCQADADENDRALWAKKPSSIYMELTPLHKHLDNYLEWPEELRSLIKPHAITQLKGNARPKSTTTFLVPRLRRLFLVPLVIAGGAAILWLLIPSLHDSKREMFERKIAEEMKCTFVNQAKADINKGKSHSLLQNFDINALNNIYAKFQRGQITVIVDDESNYLHQLLGNPEIPVNKACKLRAAFNKLGADIDAIKKEVQSDQHNGPFTNSIRAVMAHMQTAEPVDYPLLTSDDAKLVVFLFDRFIPASLPMFLGSNENPVIGNIDKTIKQISELIRDDTKLLKAFRRNEKEDGLKNMTLGVFELLVSLSISVENRT